MHNLHIINRRKDVKVFCSLDYVQIRKCLFSTLFWTDYLSFFPKREKCTYRLGCAFKSTNRESAETMVASRWV